MPARRAQSRLCAVSLVLVLHVFLILFAVTEAKKLGLKVTIDQLALWTDPGTGWAYHSWLKDGKSGAIKHFGEWDLDQNDKPFWLDEKVAAFLLDTIEDYFFITIERDPMTEKTPSNTMLLTTSIKNAVVSNTSSTNTVSRTPRTTFPLAVGSPSFGRNIASAKAKFFVDFPVTDPHGTDENRMAIMFAIQYWGASLFLWKNIFSTIFQRGQYCSVQD